MVDLIAQYRQDVETILRESLAPYEAQTIATEIEVHLRERCEASIELGATPETAQLEALAAMGPSTQLAREFIHQKPKTRVLEPVASNLTMLGLFALPALFERAFVANTLFNSGVVAAWFTVPAFSRRWPLWGILGGVLVIELFLFAPAGRANWQRDIPGILQFVAFTLATYLIGWLVRNVVARVRRNKRRTLA